MSGSIRVWSLRSQLTLNERRKTLLKKSDPVDTQIALLRCPLLDAAKRNPEIVCNVHLGLVRGMLEVIDSDDVSADLDAFAVPGACILHVQQDVDKASKRPATINREEATRR